MGTNPYYLMAGLSYDARSPLSWDQYVEKLHEEFPTYERICRAIGAWNMRYPGIFNLAQEILQLRK